MAQYGFYFDSSRCTGCHTCELACKDYHDLSQTETFRKVYDYEGGETVAGEDGIVTSATAFMYHVSAACNHCTTPACVDACPAGAIVKDEETGIVYVDKDTCAGAKACIEACPYGVPIWREEEKKADKCDLCRSRIAEGKRPICVDACPLRALDFGEIEELRSKYPDGIDNIAPLADPAATGPNVVIKPGPAAKTAGDTEGAVANEETVTGVAARF